jgi:hypothetical protein
MSEINLHNYEAYLLDFSENNLSSEDAKELQIFLETHPEIDADIFDTSNLHLSPESTNFNGKLSLKRNEEIPELNEQDTILIGLMENDLSIEEIKIAEKLISENSTAAKDFDLYKKTKLSSNPKIHFQNKENLKKRAGFIPMYMLQYVAAAAVITGILITVFLQTNTKNMLQEMPDQIASTNTEIHIDQDVTQNSGSNMNQNTCETNTDKQVSIINNQTTEDSHKIATETKKIIYTPISLKHMPKINVGTLQENKQSENLAVIEYKNAKENKDFNWKEMNITYVKNTPENNSKIKFPKNFNEMDATLAELDKKYNPILKLREAKEELLAINVQKLFNK